MKIAKKLNKEANQPIQSSMDVVTESKYDTSIKYIQKAIDSLADVAKDDQDAKDAIANLSVILFDLKG